MIRERDKSDAGPPKKKIRVHSMTEVEEKSGFNPHDLPKGKPLRRIQRFGGVLQVDELPDLALANVIKHLPARDVLSLMGTTPKMQDTAPRAMESSYRIHSPEIHQNELDARKRYLDASRAASKAEADAWRDRVKRKDRAPRREVNVAQRDAIMQKNKAFRTYSDAVARRRENSERGRVSANLILGPERARGR